MTYDSKRYCCIILAIWFMALLFCDTVLSQNIDDDLNDLDLDFTIEDIEKKPYSINADLELKETIKIFNEDALLFKQKYLNKKNEDTFWQTDLDLTIEGEYKKDIIKLYGRFNGMFYYNDIEDLEFEKELQEAYLSLQFSHSFSIDAGKKVYKWGKGYAFSPPAFFSRPKDIDDPDATLEGYYSISLDFIKSYEGFLQTLAITPVLMPVNKDLNYDIGQKNELIWGGKLYLFAFDTDFDFMFLISDNLDDHYGIDFSKNLTTAFEIHGDAAIDRNYNKYIIDEHGNTSVTQYTAFNFLLGVRYLSTQDTTYILEYFHNDQGYSSQEYENYLTFIETGFDNYLNTSNTNSILKSRKYAAFYNQQAAMRDYLYLKISQKEPFDILYFIPGIIFIHNLNDQSTTITPYFTYSPLTNLTLEVKIGFLVGGYKTEYGEKINKAKFELSIQYYF